MHPHAAAADPSCDGRLPVCVTVRSRDIVAAPRAAHRCPTPRAHQLPIAPPAATAAVRRTRQRRVSRPLRVTPIAAPPPAPATSHRADADTSFAVAPPRATHRCPTPRAHQRAILPMRRRHVSWPLRVTPIAAPSPAAATSHPADAETPCVVAAPRDAHLCPIPRAHQRPIAPPATTAVDATEEATPCAGFSSAEDTGCYSLLHVTLIVRQKRSAIMYSHSRHLSSSYP